MAGQEFTQTFSVASAGTGPTDVAYFLLQNDVGNGTYIIKNISYYATVDFLLSNYGIAIGSSSDNAGTNLFPVYVSTPNPVTSENIVTQISNDFIVNKNYISVTANLAGVGTLYLTITYIYIPSTSPWAANFLSYPSLIDNGAKDALSGPGSGNAYIIKSIYLCNLNSSEANVQIELSSPNGSQDILLDTRQTIDSGNTYIFTKPIYLQVGYTLTINNDTGESSVPIESLISYTLDPSEPDA